MDNHQNKNEFVDLYNCILDDNYSLTELEHVLNTTDEGCGISTQQGIGINYTVHPEHLIQGILPMVPPVQVPVMNPSVAQPETHNEQQMQHLEKMSSQQLMRTDVSQVNQTKEKKGRNKKPKEPKKYQQTTPFKDRKLELQRINAIKAKEYRDRKKHMEAALKAETVRLQLELRNNDLQRDQLIEEINRLRQENYQLKKELS
ncbi:uncharacterized protein LOC135113213 isoform X1 [Scylla paramamosain]|uniref:uncharacterized protein LOC135113213 isoform X1 n=1 Tax=Scylla paramamosain TaxID=85552 RepID=UPI00308288E8